MPIIRFTIYFLLPLLASFFLPIIGQGRENHITGGIAVREGYDSNAARDQEEVENYWTTTISPSFDFSSQGRWDNITIFYEPGLQIRDREGSQKTISDVHHLELRAENALPQNFRASLTENFRLTNDPYLQDPELTNNISEEMERRGFWTNAITFSIDWNYAMGSNLTLGYTNNVFEQQDAWLTGDYERHTPFLNLIQQLGRRWRASISYSYSNANFEDASSSPPENTAAQEQRSNIDNNNATIQLDFNPSQHSTLYASCAFTDNKFEEILAERQGENYKIYTGRLGWRQVLGPNINVALSMGPSQVNREQRESENALNYEGLLSGTTGRADFTLSGRGGFNEIYYNGTNDGLTKFWLFDASLGYQVTRKLTLRLSGYFRNNELIEREATATTEQLKEDISQAGLESTFSLNRWTTLSLRYSYRNSDTNEDRDDDGEEDGYDVHRLFLELRASRELWRW